jgi:hypothetical protein
MIKFEPVFVVCDPEIITPFTGDRGFASGRPVGERDLIKSNENAIVYFPGFNGISFFLGGVRITFRTKREKIC